MEIANKNEQFQRIPGVILQSNQRQVRHKTKMQRLDICLLDICLSSYIGCKRI